MGAIYFVQADGEGGPIKIGMTDGNVFVRLAQIASTTRRRLTLLGVMSGDRWDEVAMHEAFADLRLSEPFPRGGTEWFRCAPEILDTARALPPFVHEAFVARVDLPRAVSRGPGALRASFTRTGLTQRAIAAKLGVTQQAVSSWLHGGSSPDNRRRQELEVLVGVPRSDWDEPALRAV